MTGLADRIARLTDEQRATLTARLAARANGGIPRAPRSGDAIGLSFTQERIWFLEQFAPGTALQNMSGVARIPMRLDPEIFSACLDEVVARHETLRTAFAVRAGDPVGIVVDRVTVPVRVLTSLSDEERERVFLEDARRPFDLALAPLLRVNLAANGPDECLVQLTMHHLVSDGFSTGVLFAELGALYSARIAGSPPPKLAPLPLQFADVAAWEHTRFDADPDGGQLKHWTAHLAGAPQQLALPADRPRPARMTYRGRRLAVEVPAALVTDVHALSRELGVTPFVTMLAGFVVVLSRYAAQDDLVVGVPVANREQSGTEQLIGPFLNTLAMRFDVADAPTFAELVQQVNVTALAGFEHQAVPFERVVQALGTTRDPSRTPLFQTVFNFQFDRSSAAGTGEIELRDLPNGHCQFDLLLNLVTSESGIAGHIDYYEDVYDEASVGRLVDSFFAVLRAAAGDAGRRVTELELVSSDRAAELLAAGTGPALAYDHERLVHDLILARCRRHPERVALIGDDGTLSYGELDARSAALAARLQATIPAAPGAHVALSLPRSVDTVVAILAVLRAGFAYVALDPGYPAALLDLICEDAGITAVVTRSDVPLLVTPGDVPVILLDTLEAGAVGSDAVVSAEHGAYTIYTSGSTGRPKGVRLSHRNVVNFLASTTERPGLDEDDVMLAVTSPSFDISVLEMILPLVTGARTVIVERADVLDGRRLAALVEEHGVTFMQGTPATWQLMMDSGWRGHAGLKCLSGGENFPPALAAQILSRCGELWNGYGPTETTIYSSYHRVTADDVVGPLIPIGRPMHNTISVVMDRGRTPVPPGVVGELWIGGDCLAIGYQRLPELTAAKFVTLGEHRLYASGDLVRARPDGTLEFAGRLDHQVKLRGFRIELGQIEATLQSHPDVRRAVAVVRGEAVGAKSIVAYVEAADATLAAQLRSYLAERLPEYMVPARIAVVEQLPLTPNGKIDRKQLPEIAEAPAAADDPAAPVLPRDETEQQLAMIWQDLLGLEAVGVHDSFFDLGGHSLLATKLVFRVRDVFGVELPLAAMFEGDLTIAELAKLVTDPAAAAGPPPPPLDLFAEAQLADDVRPTPGAHVHSVHYPQHSLVTGATGFVGAFLLAELLRTTEITPFCLVRAASVAEGHERIRTTLTGYGLWEESYGARIHPVLGALDRPRLGLSRPEWQHLAAMVDVIYHSGAYVNFLQPYDVLKVANVQGTEEILRLACDGSVKPVHFVSSTYVFARFSYPPHTRFTEDMEPIQGLERTFGYTQSKWVSEHLVREAGRRGLPVYIYRLGRVAGHSQTGACSTYDFVWQAIKVGLEIGAAPEMDMTLDVTPVDYMVGAMAHLSRQPALQGQIFHLVSDEPIEESYLVNWLEDYGYQSERLTFPAWCARVLERAGELSDTTAGALAPFLSGTLPLDRIPPASFGHANVDRGLAGSGITCPPIDERLLRLYFDYFTATGYLPQPHDRPAAELAGVTT